MLRFAKIAGCLAALVLAGLRPALGFALLGPQSADVWEVPTIGYLLPGDVGAPKNLGEGYRRNTPVMFYACDANFLDYFGSNGLAQVDAAFTVYNNIFDTNVSSFSSDLHEFPTEAMQRNYVAQNLALIDLKTAAMWLIEENLGLAEPERYTWCIHDRYLPPGGVCPVDEEYLLVKRNFDPTLGTLPYQLLPSSYVNGTMYSYDILEICTGPNPLAITLPFPVDATADTFTSLAGTFGNLNLLSPYGSFFTDLTRDDVGGLRYLLNSNNIAFEGTGPGTTVAITNDVPQLLFTSNLTLFAQEAFTNPPAALQALYPNLVINASSNYWVNVFTTNFTVTFVNSPYDPGGYPPTHPVYQTNVTETVVPVYRYSFGNLSVLVFTNGMWEAVPAPDITLFSNYTVVNVQTSTISLTSPTYDPAGLFTIITNSTSRSVALRQISGEYVIFPTNLCGIGQIQLQADFVSTFTNVLLNGSNTTTLTNVIGTTVPLSVTAQQVEVFTNYAFVYLPINCVTNNTGLYEGVEQLKFFRANFDSLTTRFFNPITNQYTLYSITNGVIVPQRVERVITEPDFLLTAQDITAGPGGVPATPFDARNVNFNANNVLPGLAGPGTIDPPVPPAANAFIFNKSGPLFFNTLGFTTNGFVNDEQNQSVVWGWGSFDGTTNPPVVYPNGTSLANLVNLVLIQITPQNLPAGAAGFSYNAQLQTQGQTGNWQAPFTWAVATNSAGTLPPGLSLSSGGLISGTPTVSGQYNFVIQVTDATGRTVNDSLYITVN